MKVSLVYGRAPFLASCLWESGDTPCPQGKRPASKAIQRQGAIPQGASPRPGNSRPEKGPLPLRPATYMELVALERTANVVVRDTLATLPGQSSFFEGTNALRGSSGPTFAYDTHSLTGNETNGA